MDSLKVECVRFCVENKANNNHDFITSVFCKNIRYIEVSMLTS